MKKYLAIILISCCQPIRSQLKVSFSEDCLEYNSLVFSDALIHVCSDDTIASWLDKEVIIVAAIMFNHHGYASNLNIVRCKNLKFSKKQKYQIQKRTLKYLKKNHSNFVLCADYMPKEMVTDSLVQYHEQRVKKLLRKKKRLRPYIGVDFNGASAFFMFYNALRADSTQTRIDILKRHIRQNVYEKSSHPSSESPSSSGSS